MFFTEFASLKLCQLFLLLYHPSINIHFFILVILIWNLGFFTATHLRSYLRLLVLLLLLLYDLWLLLLNWLGHLHWYLSVWLLRTRPYHFSLRSNLLLRNLDRGRLWFVVNGKYVPLLDHACGPDLSCQLHIDIFLEEIENTCNI